jgi:hypothetical protein
MGDEYDDTIRYDTIRWTLMNLALLVHYQHRCLLSIFACSGGGKMRNRIDTIISTTYIHYTKKKLIPFYAVRMMVGKESSRFTKIST